MDNQGARRCAMRFFFIILSSRSKRAWISIQQNVLSYPNYSSGPIRIDGANQMDRKNWLAGQKYILDGPVDTVGGGGDVLVVEQDSAALESGDADVSLPGELAESGLIAADNALLELAGFERLDAAEGPGRREAVDAVDADVGRLDKKLLLHLVVLVLIELLLSHDGRRRGLEPVVRNASARRWGRAERIVTDSRRLVGEVAQLLLRPRSCHPLNWYKRQLRKKWAIHLLFLQLAGLLDPA